MFDQHNPPQGHFTAVVVPVYNTCFEGKSSDLELLFDLKKAIYAQWMCKVIGCDDMKWVKGTCHDAGYTSHCCEDFDCQMLHIQQYVRPDSTGTFVCEKVVKYANQ